MGRWIRLEGLLNTEMGVGGDMKAGIVCRAGVIRSNVAVISLVLILHIYIAKHFSCQLQTAPLQEQPPLGWREVASSHVRAMRANFV